MTVTLERVGEFLSRGGGWYTTSDFRNFNALCWFIEGKLGHALTFSQAVIIQAMLGTPSVKWAQIGPGGKLAYRRVEGKS